MSRLLRSEAREKLRGNEKFGEDDETRELRDKGHPGVLKKTVASKSVLEAGKTFEVLKRTESR